MKIRRHLCRRLRVTFLTIVSALFPSGTEENRPGGSKGDVPLISGNGSVSVRGRDLRLLLSDPARFVGPEGKLELFIPDALSIASPFLLYRLKRTGFSNCRAGVTKDGVTVSAAR